MVRATEEQPTGGGLSEPTRASSPSSVQRARRAQRGPQQGSDAPLDDVEDVDLQPL
ncbi:hypothetical protein [Curtobacterium sp. VKM Ac-2852]|uniref:hypothetical protein n=1 Tax=Curtobacterium sp. VKM Ac-2852 TaxID=2739024 RepID=UPI001565B8C3|nr:hypothetical protein [Curtobacterium sp. VKM Ac-2852]NQX25478.1 hypothetical protein [Curtobacterium sp. VKM Ac-2852]